VTAVPRSITVIIVFLRIGGFDRYSSHISLVDEESLTIIAVERTPIRVDKVLVVDILGNSTGEDLWKRSRAVKRAGD
jgi:hypothetical protein